MTCQAFVWYEVVIIHACRIIVLVHIHYAYNIVELFFGQISGFGVGCWFFVIGFTF